MREIGFEHFVHFVIVIDLGEEDGQLDNVVHIRTTRFNKLFHFVEDRGRVRANIPLRSRPAIVRSLARDVYEPMMRDDRRDHLRSLSRLSFIVQLLDSGFLMRALFRFRRFPP